MLICEKIVKCNFSGEIAERVGLQNLQPWPHFVHKAIAIVMNADLCDSEIRTENFMEQTIMNII